MYLSESYRFRFQDMNHQNYPILFSPPKLLFLFPEKFLSNSIQRITVIVSLEVTWNRKITSTALKGRNATKI